MTLAQTHVSVATRPQPPPQPVIHPSTTPLPPPTSTYFLVIIRKSLCTGQWLRLAVATIHHPGLAPLGSPAALPRPLFSPPRRRHPSTAASPPVPWVAETRRAVVAGPERTTAGGAAKRAATRARTTQNSPDKRTGAAHGQPAAPRARPPATAPAGARPIACCIVAILHYGRPGSCPEHDVKQLFSHAIFAEPCAASPGIIICALLRLTMMSPHVGRR